MGDACVAPISRVWEGHDYALAVVHGEILASQWVKLACRRHLSELERSGWFRDEEGSWDWAENRVDPEFDCWFDEESAREMLDIACRIRLFKGRGAGKEFNPQPWQVLILISLFGWIRLADDTRRFRRLYVEVARKQGKSMLVAIIAILLTFCDGEPGAGACTAATTAKQARIVFESASKLLNKTPELVRSLGITIHRDSISRPADDQKLEPVSAEAGTKDGDDLHVVVIDEYHAHPTRDLYDVLEEATAARPQPVTLVITTAGPGNDPTNPCRVERDRCTAVLKRFAEGKPWRSDGEDFVYVACLDAKADGAEKDDDYTKSDLWIKANPNLGVTVQPEYLWNKIDRAQGTPSALPGILRKHFNLWVGAAESWLPHGAWSGLEDTELDWAALEGEECWGGLDLAETMDLAGWCLWFPKQQALWAKAWVPEDLVGQLERKHVAPYQEWIDCGWLEPLPGDYMIPSDIVDSVARTAEKFKIRSIAYDPALSRDVVPHLEEMGLDVAKHPQSYVGMTPAVRAAERQIITKRLRHCGNGPLAWCVGNMAIETSRDGTLIRPSRKLARRKIDLAVAMVMAIGWWAENGHQNQGSAYNDPETELMIV